MSQSNCYLRGSCPIIIRLVLETGRTSDEKDQISYLALRLHLGPIAYEI